MRPEPVVERRWGARHAFYALLAGLVAAFAALTLVIGFTGDLPTDAQSFGIVLPAQAIGTLAAAWWIMRSYGTGDPARDVGLRFRPSDLWGLPAGLALEVALALALFPVFRLLDIDDSPQQIGELAGRARGLTVVLAVVSVAVLAPLAEEVLFRGLLLRALSDRWSETAAVAASAAAFAAVHLTDPGAAPVVPALFVVGVVVGMAAVRRGDLGLAIAIHAGFNLTALIGIFLVE